MFLDIFFENKYKDSSRFSFVNVFDNKIWHLLCGNICKNNKRIFQKVLKSNQCWDKVWKIFFIEFEKSSKNLIPIYSNSKEINIKKNDCIIKWL